MKILSALLWSAIVIYLLCYIVLLILTKKPFKVMIINALVAWWCFALIELTAFYTGLHIPINVGTVTVSGVLGVPGVVLLEIMKYIIFV